MRYVNHLFKMVLGVYIACYAAAAYASVDIRTSGNLASKLDQIDYIASVSDCSKLVSVNVLAGTNQEAIPVSNSRRIEGSPVACEFVFTGIGEGRFTPQITLNYQDLTTFLHQETFLVEDTSPQLAFESVGLQLINGTQNG